MAAPYDDRLMDHIKNARNYCILDDASRTATGANPLCGDEMTVFLELGENQVERAAFQCSCCGISMASASVMTESLAGKNVKEALTAIRAFVARLEPPGAAVLPAPTADQEAVVAAVRRFPSRLRCALLPWITAEAALEGREEASFGR